MQSDANIWRKGSIDKEETRREVCVKHLVPQEMEENLKSRKILFVRRPPLLLQEERVFVSVRTDTDVLQLELGSVSE